MAAPRMLQRRPSCGEGARKCVPELDNIGSYLTVGTTSSRKFSSPRVAEGFEKEYEKGKMPDKYKDLDGG